MVVAIQEEASKDVESAGFPTHWISLGALSRLIEILQAEAITEVIMAGQVKHAKIFSSIRPDWRLVKLLAALPSRNTDGLIGGVMKILADEGIQLRDSTTLLKPLLADEGAMTRRKPDKAEQTDIDYGRRIANALAGFDVGQSVAICERACVAVEAMEGTDAMLRRAAGLVNGRRLSLVKVARRRGHLLFDVPVAGLDTIAVMRETGATVLAVDVRPHAAARPRSNAGASARSGDRHRGLSAGRLRWRLRGVRSCVDGGKSDRWIRCESP